jgi:Esterase-like activity of phytase
MNVKRAMCVCILGMLPVASVSYAGQSLIAAGALDASGGDLATKTAKPLENGLVGNLFGGTGSGLANAGGDRFIALPDRGPNAVAYNDCIDDTTSYIPRFHTLRLRLVPKDGSSLPFVLKPSVDETTLMASSTPLTYASGLAGCPSVPDGAPKLNTSNHTYYFTGRSDNFGSGLSTNPTNARFDPESVRLSRDTKSIFVSDEYGPYIYRFGRESGVRTAVFTLPPKFAVDHLAPVESVEISENLNGRVANKGMEGLAITPDGSTLVGMMQSALAQDGGDVAGQVLRIVTIDIELGVVTHEYAYQTTVDGRKYTVSDIVAVNDHVFLVDERDGRGLGDNSDARFKKLFLIDLDPATATDVGSMAGHDDLAANAVPKFFFLDVVAELTKPLGSGGLGLTKFQVPAKLEGIAFGEDVVVDGETKHTLFIANDNDFLPTVNGQSNPNQFFVFAFGDEDLQSAFNDEEHANLSLEPQIFEKK